MKREKVGSVYSTYDYNAFRRMIGNRDVKKTKVNEIISSIEKHGQLMVPVIVNNNMEIVDGQHRFEAFMALDLPIYYVTQNNVGIDECRDMNKSQDPWRVMDYIKSYAELGNTSYQYLLVLVQQFRGKVGVETICYMTRPSSSIASGGSAYVPIRNGKFEMSEHRFYKLKKRLENMDDLGFFAFMKKKKMHQRSFTPAVNYAYLHPDVDPHKLMKALERNPGNIVSCFDTSEQLRNFDDAYNYGVARKFRVYMETDYKKGLYLDEEDK